MVSTARGATVVVRGTGGLTLERPTLEIFEKKRGVRHRFDAAMVRIGAGPGNDLLLQDPTVSSVHAEIASTHEGIRLRDLGSTNGTRVNGVRVTDAFLEDGANVVVGDVDLEFRIGQGKVQQPLSEVQELAGAVGSSPEMRTVFARVEKVAKTDATVLINGETGTGKEVIAWSIYESSKRAEKPFVVVDCSAIAPTLIESELFGHEKGAFTGAHQRRIGAFERAHGGTLFLDEIGELGIELQPKLLRALERREVSRLGGEKPTQVDVRILAATNRDLRAMVARGEFREDLYYRLAVVRLELPPLRERKSDIPLLVERFLKAMSLSKDALPPGTMERFMEHSWPGNARELKNAVERVAVLGEMSFMSPSAQAPDAPMPASTSASAIDVHQPYKDQKNAVIADFEERYVRALMKAHSGNVSAASRVAGIDRMSLHKILARYGLDARELSKD